MTLSPRSHILLAAAAVATFAVPQVANAASAQTKPAPAQQQIQEVSPEQLALARKYVELTDSEHIFERTISKTAIDTFRTILRQDPTIADKAKAAVTKTVDTYKSRKADLFDKFARVYALHFTADELQKIVDFYSTDVGKKLTATKDGISRELTSVVEVFTNNLNADFYADVKANLKADGVNL